MQRRACQLPRNHRPDPETSGLFLHGPYVVVIRDKWRDPRSISPPGATFEPIGWPRLFRGPFQARGD